MSSEVNTISIHEFNIAYAIVYVYLSLKFEGNFVRSPKVGKWDVIVFGT